ncbi:MAG: gluconokinase [Armatimonadota bacterium]
MNYVLSLDVGTSSIRAALYDERGEPVPGAAAGVSHAPAASPDGGVEMDAEALLQRSLGCVEQVLRLAGERARRIAGVGISTFWHSILGVRADGLPATPVLMWADTRSVAEVAELRSRLDERALHARTGALLHTSYPGPRLLWAAHHRPEWLRESARWMSPGEYFHARLFGAPACSISMASGTGFYHHQAGQWDETFLSELPVRAEQLSPIVDTGTPFVGLTPELAARLPQLSDVPWFPAAGDGACSNVGSGCVSPERVALMVGTSGAVRVMAEGPAPETPWGLWRYRWDARRYLQGGALSNGGSLFAWLRDTLKLPAAEELEAALSAGEPDGHGLTVLPFLAGERCPGWRGDARAAIVGLSWSTRPEEILRAGLEAVAYRFALIHELLAPVAAPEHQIVATGGALLASPAWTQMVADALGREVAASRVEEASARGAALLALEGAGLIRDLRDLPAPLGRVFSPDPERHARYREARERQAKLYQALVGTDWAGAGSGLIRGA